MVRLAIAFEGILIVLAWSLGWLFGAQPFDRVHLKWQAMALGVGATCPLLLAMWWCSRSQWRPFRSLMFEVEDKVIPLFASCSQFELILVSMLAGVGEEALFRGVLQTLLANLMNSWVALVGTSALFGLGHFISPTYAVLAGLLGLYLGGLSIAHNNLLVAIVTHALYDYIALNYLLQKYRG